MTTKPIEVVLSKVAGVRRNGDGWIARCPAHGDQDPSLAIKEAEDGKVLLHCHAGCTAEKVCEAMGLRMADLFPQECQEARRMPTEPVGHLGPLRENWPPSGSLPANVTASGALDAVPDDRGLIDLIVQTALAIGGKPTSLWPYHYSDGRLSLIVARFETKPAKTFRPFHYDGRQWVCGDPDGLLPLYRLFEIQGGSPIYVCEGEKAVEAARALGLTATTSAHGARSAHKTDWSPLAGKDVVILPDNDDAGRQYAQDVANLLTKLNPPVNVMTLHLPALPPGGDIVDFIEARQNKTAGEVKAEIERLVRSVRHTHGTIGVPIIVNLADVEPRPVEWLWPNRIPLGKLTMVVGYPGLGKSTLALDIVARVTRGIPWPDLPNEPISAGAVILLSAEDDLADTIRPRLDAAGAEPRQIHILKAVRDVSNKERLFSLERDIEILERAIKSVPNCRLVVIDPITAYLGNIDSHKNTDVRSVLAPLADLASRHNVAIICVGHLNKREGVRAIHRVTGSTGFVEAARAVWLVAEDSQNPDMRLMVRMKGNLAKDIGGLAFRLVEVSQTSHTCRMEWHPGPIWVTPDQLLRPPDQAEGSLEYATKWLKTQLQAGPMKAIDIQKNARAEGISDRTLKRAKQRLGVISTKEDFSGAWIWSLTPISHNDDEGTSDPQGDGRDTNTL